MLNVECWHLVFTIDNRPFNIVYLRKFHAHLTGRVGKEKKEQRRKL